jgi:hypothetical protein
MAADTIPSAKLPDDQKTLRDPVRALAFQCMCGCDLFRVDVEIYADHSWASVLSCAACGHIRTPTEPITNGPH